MEKFHANRTGKLTTSIFATIAKLAVEYKAVNLGQGFPDFNGPEWIMEEAHKAMLAGKNQYAPMNGIFTLRQAIQQYHKKYYGMDWNTETEITVTAGATEALFASINGTINEGDEVIMFEPYYDSYFANVLISGGVPKCVTLKKPNFEFDYEELEKAVTQQTKAIIVNNPHNPTGKVYSLDELEFIAKLANKHDLLVISDEVYEFLTFDGSQRIPISTLPGMKDRTITVSSAGKTFGMTGWKIGWTVAPPYLSRAVQNIHQWATFAVNTPGQHAMAHAFNRLDEYLPDFRKMYQYKKDLVYNALKDTDFKPHQSYGSYFIMVDIPQNKIKDDVECAMKLIKEFGVATIPPSVFYMNSEEGKTMLRLCFAKQDEIIKEGVKRITNFK